MIRVARKILRDDGFAALSVRHLASSLGVSRQVVYTHFDGMDGLLNALHRLGADLLAGDVAALEETPGTDAHVLAAAQAYVDAARLRPALFELVFSSPIPQYTPTEETTAASRASFEHIVAAAAAWLARRRSRAGDRRDAFRLARILWAQTHGHVVLEVAGHARPADTDRLVALAVGAVLRGWPDRACATE
ncbi:MAG: TetR/AcrR family transcriptional regulator [Myxococcota bacterium]